MKRLQLILALSALMVLTGAGGQVCAQGGSEAGGVRPQTARRNLAILVFDGVQIIDYTGPYEAFGHAFKKGGSEFNIYTVAEKGGAVETAMGMSVNPKYSFENAPQPNVLVIPGGGGVWKHLDNPNVIKWIQEKARGAEVVMSVCNGAFFLARAGLLDGQTATTTFNLLPKLREAAPKAKVVDTVRYVDNGKIVTTAGLSSGIDGALHLIERFYGKGMAQMAATGMEYNWDPKSNYVRAALAERYMPWWYEGKVFSEGWKPVTREGDTDRWENKWIVSTESTAAKLLESVNTYVANNREFGGLAVIKWSRVDGDSPRNPNQSLWQFTDERGDAWNGVVTVEPLAGEQNQVALSVKIARRKARLQPQSNRN